MIHTQTGHMTENEQKRVQIQWTEGLRQTGLKQVTV